MADHERQLRLFGARLRALRGDFSLTELARRVNSSKSVLSRLERGERLPARDLIERLDEHHAAGGALVTEWERLRRGSWEVADAETFKVRWSHNYPAAYSGEIWMRLRLPSDRLGGRVGLQVRWGPWVLRQALTVDTLEGVALWHTKGDDGLSVPVIVRASEPVGVAFHVGDPPDDAIDINPGWVNDGR